MKTGFTLPEECPRGRTNCVPYSQIVSDGGETFICCGRHDGTISPVLQDVFTLCFKSETSDSITCNDKRDLIQLSAVITRALSIDEELGGEPL